jgi:hypothetical protein
MYKVQDFRKETSVNFSADVYVFGPASGDSPNVVGDTWNFMRWLYKSDLVISGQEPGNVSKSSTIYFDIEVAHIIDNLKRDLVVPASPSYTFGGSLGTNTNSISQRAFLTVSSRRFKEDIVYDDTVPSFRGLKTTTFRYKDVKYRTAWKNSGLIAEDLEDKGLTSILLYDDDDPAKLPRGINSAGIDGLLVRALGVAQEDIDSLREDKQVMADQITALQIAFNALELRVAALEVVP